MNTESGDTELEALVFMSCSKVIDETAVEVLDRSAARLNATVILPHQKVGQQVTLGVME